MRASGSVHRAAGCATHSTGAVIPRPAHGRVERKSITDRSNDTNLSSIALTAHTFPPLPSGERAGVRGRHRRDDACKNARPTPNKSWRGPLTLTLSPRGEGICAYVSRSVQL